MERSVEIPVGLPGVRAVRSTVASLHAKMKDHHAVGRVEHGDCEWWGGGKVWRAAPGCILVKQPGDVHRDLARSGPQTFVTITLPTSDVADVQDGGETALLAQLAPDDPRAAPFHRLVDAVCAGAERLALEVALAEAIGSLTEIRHKHADRSRPVRRAMEYLRDRLGDSFTLADLAAYAEFDKFHLCRAFRAQIGLPPHAYLTRLRIARAKQLLVGGVRASEVAPLVGFCDQAQLTRHFRRIVGTTPARYARSPRTATT